MELYSILNNDLVYKLIVPCIIAIIGCVFDAKTVKDRTRWMISVKIYSNSNFILLSILISIGCGCFFIGIKYLFMNDIINIYFFVYCIVTIILFLVLIYIKFLRFTIEVEKEQKLLQLIFYVLLIINGCLDSFGFRSISLLLSFGAFFSEIMLFRKYPYEIIHIEHKYADLFFDDNSVLKNVEIFLLKKSSSWIIIMRNDNSETRIPIARLKKINYYGPECLIKKVGKKYVYL